ncbi:MAG TPA: LytTR family DNA-binding domain-containing protein [Vineibacter sp.]|nr:LytTR family DNA-binding domain-containing protein [Vineibacter sp.]
MQGHTFRASMSDQPSTTQATSDTPPSWWRRVAASVVRHRIVLAWIVILAIVAAINVATVLADARRQGRDMDVAWAVLLEGTSHLVLGALVPVLYWIHRRFPVVPIGVNLAVHALATLPFSLAHVVGMFALRWVLAPLLGGRYPLRLDLDTLFYEYRKDVLTYLIFSTALVALRYVFAAPRDAEPAPPPEPYSGAGRLERFAVRRKDKEVVVAAQDIAWIEAAGNYAVLHVGGETFDIRSSLSRLEAELDPARFVRVHKSYIVNVERVREVEPWLSGDSRLKLDDGAVVSLSRRYRARFEKVVPVRT